MNVAETYKKIFNQSKASAMLGGCTEDKANRLATKHAIQRTWLEFNRPGEKKYYFYSVTQDYYDGFIIHKDVFWETNIGDAFNEVCDRFDSTEVDELYEIPKEDFDVLRRYL